MAQRAPEAIPLVALLAAAAWQPEMLALEVVARPPGNPSLAGSLGAARFLALAAVVLAQV
jgi:hypothetical protein